MLLAVCLIATAGSDRCVGSDRGPVRSITDEADSETQSGSPLPLMLRIQWERGANLPQGFQDSDGGIIDSQLVTVGGFCGGGLDEDHRRKPGR